MSHELRERIDATEAFAADVAHELKNPLASLSSAVESLKRVVKPELRDQLHAVIADDVRRLDRLITDVADLSRIDAKIARTRFERVDVGAMISSLLNNRSERNLNGNCRIAFARPEAGSAAVSADASQLVRVFENLLDNAVSFSPEGGTIRIAATATDNIVIVTVDDDGPGISESAREAIFERFHSDRPESEFGRHSGLGLAIARAIVEAHDGTIRAQDRGKGQQGGSFVVTFPKEER